MTQSEYSRTITVALRTSSPAAMFSCRQEDKSYSDEGFFDCLWGGLRIRDPQGSKPYLSPCEFPNLHQHSLALGEALPKPWCVPGSNKPLSVRKSKVKWRHHGHLKKSDGWRHIPIAHIWTPQKGNDFNQRSSHRPILSLQSIRTALGTPPYMLLFFLKKRAFLKSVMRGH